MLAHVRVARAAVPRVRYLSTVQPPVPFAWKKLHGQMPVIVPVTDSFFPGVPCSSEGEPITSVPATKVSTLSNGVRVATLDSPGLASSVGIFLDSGSRFETAETQGVAHFLKNAAFRATTNRSHFRAVRELESAGAIVSCISTRDNILYLGDCLRDHIPIAFRVMADTVLNPRLADADIEEVRQAVAADAEFQQEDAQLLLSDAVHSAAYGFDGLGRATLCSSSSAETLQASHISSFLNNTASGANIVVAGYAVAHETLVELAEEAFGGLAAGTKNAPAAKYMGGDVRVQGVRGDPFTHVAIGFEGVSWNSEDLLTASVLHMLLGGGDSFSAGGPGKGMLSRLFVNVLSHYHWVNSAVAFSHSYNDTGVFGVQGSAFPEQAGQLVSVLANELKSVAATAPAADEVARAKKQLRSAMLMNLEARQTIVDDIGRQILTYGKHLPASEFVARAEQVTPQGVQQLVQKMLQSQVSFAAAGPCGITYNDVCAQFK